MLTRRKTEGAMRGMGTQDSTGTIKGIYAIARVLLVSEQPFSHNHTAIEETTVALKGDRAEDYVLKQGLTL